MSLDLTKSAQDILVQQLNKDNPTAALTDASVTFSPVMLNSDPDAATYEAVIEVIAVQGQAFSGSYFYKYNRIDLASIFNGSNNSFPIGAAKTLADLLPAINSALGTNFTITTLPNNDTNQLYVQGDVMPLTLPVPTHQTPSIKFMLTADPNSPIYRGAAMLTLTTTAADLSAAVSAPSTGLTYTAPG